MHAVLQSSLQKPYVTGVAVRNSPLIIPRDDRALILPHGFIATLYADKLDHPRQLAFLPNGDALVSMQDGGYIMLMRDADGDGRAEWIERHAAGFNGPYGIAYRDKQILVADQDGIYAIDYTPGLVRPPFAGAKPIGEVPPAERRPQQFMDGQKLLTAKGVIGIVQGHYNRSLRVGPDDTLYVGVVSAGNIGVEPSPKSTSVVADEPIPVRALCHQPTVEFVEAANRDRLAFPYRESEFVSLRFPLSNA